MRAYGCKNSFTFSKPSKSKLGAYKYSLGSNPCLKSEKAVNLSVHTNSKKLLDPLILPFIKNTTTNRSVRRI